MMNKFLYVAACDSLLFLNIVNICFEQLPTLWLKMNKLMNLNRQALVYASAHVDTTYILHYKDPPR